MGLAAHTIIECYFMCLRWTVSYLSCVSEINCICIGHALIDLKIYVFNEGTSILQDIFVVVM